MSKFETKPAKSIYNEILMEHSANSPYKKNIDKPTTCSLGHNPNCGDEIKLEAIIKNGVIVDLAFSGHGCAISQSSTSIMIENLLGKKVEEAKKIIQLFLKMIKREKLTEKEKKQLGDGVIFENVSNMPTRAKCATLSWHTLENMLNDFNNSN